MIGSPQKQSAVPAGGPLSKSPANNHAADVLLYTIYAVYFFNGMALCFEGAFNPELKDFFHLSYQQQMYTMFAKNIPFVFAAAIGLLITRIGYKNCLTAALLLFAVGTGLLVIGLNARSYGTVLAGFLAIGIGFNFQLVAGNPLLCSLGAPETGSSRLNLGNALGAIAQIIAPLIISLIIPETVVSVNEKLPYIKGLFIVIALLLAAFALFTWTARDAATFENAETSAAKKPPSAQAATSSAAGWLFGFIAIFLILGAEAGLFGFYRNYLEDPKIAGLTSHQSQRMFTIYFGVFAAGRLAGAWIQKRIRPAAMLIFNLVAALILLAPVAAAHGPAAVVAITALGFFVSILFPTMYSLGIEGMGLRTARVSGFLTTGFLGCALLPLAQGRIADAVGLQRSFLLCLAPYAFALIFAAGHLRKKTSARLAA
jgi:FHS family L-fucose permease-like MFS transporter